MLVSCGVPNRWQNISDSYFLFFFECSNLVGDAAGLLLTQLKWAQSANKRKKPKARQESSEARPLGFRLIHPLQTPKIRTRPRLGKNKIRRNANSSCLHRNNVKKTIGRDAFKSNTYTPSSSSSTYKVKEQILESKCPRKKRRTSLRVWTACNSMLRCPRPSSHTTCYVDTTPPPKSLSLSLSASHTHHQNGISSTTSVYTYTNILRERTKVNCLPTSQQFASLLRAPNF